MHISPSMPPYTELTLPASCFSGNPVSPISPDGHPEPPEVDAVPLSQPGESEVEVPSLSPSHPPAVTSRCHQLPTPVELQDTRLQMNTTPTRWGGSSSVCIHQLRQDRKASAQPSAVHSDPPGQIPSTVVIPPTPIDPQALHHPHQYYPHYQILPTIQLGYPQLPGAVMYPQQLHMHLPYTSHLQPTESQVTSPFLASTPALMPASPPPTAKLQNCPGSAPLTGSMHQLAGQGIPFASHSHPPKSRVTSPFLVPTVPAHTSTPAPTLAVSIALTCTLTPALTSSTPPIDNVCPLTPAPVSPLPVKHSPPTSVEDSDSKPKFKVGRRLKEDQEDWDRFVWDCDHMFLSYAKKKSMLMEQVFTQYSALKKRLNAES